MLPILIRIVIGLLLMIHGFAHWNITSLWGSQPAHSSALLGALGLPAPAIQTLGTVLWATVLIAFLIAGLGIFIHQSWWRPVTVAASALSLAVILLFWSPNMVLGAAVDIAVIVALLWVHWPRPEMIGV